MQTMKAHHVSLTVKDMERSLAFYSGILGMRVTLDVEIWGDWVENLHTLPETRLRVVWLDAFGQWLELREFLHPEIQERCSLWAPGSAHISFLVEDIQEAYRELSDKGVRFLSPPEMLQQGPNKTAQIVFFLDPDGIGIELLQSPDGREFNIDPHPPQAM